MPRELRVAVLGLGSVGRALLRRLGATPGQGLRVVAAADRSGLIRDAAGLDPRRLVQSKRRRGGLGTLKHASHTDDVVQGLEEGEHDVVVDLLPADYHDGGLSLGLTLAALRDGRSVVTANKAPLAVEPDALRAAAVDGARLEFTGTVGGGLPIVRVLRGRGLGDVRRVTGVLNGTTNLLLSRIERGEAFDASLRDAQRQGVAEADPRHDLEGWDAAAKGVILHNLLFQPLLRIGDARREGVGPATEQRALEAHEGGRRLRSVVVVEAGRVDVRLRALEPSDPLAFDGLGAACRIISAPRSRTVLAGPGAGAPSTAHAVYEDLVAVRDGTRTTPKEVDRGVQAS
jgi:homoserine dehydrogenase